MLSSRRLCAFLIPALVGTFHARADELAASKKDLPAAAQNPVAAITLDQLSATRERPLFAPDRKRPAPPAVAAYVAPPPPPPPEPPKLSLFGTVVDPEGPRAVVRLETNSKVMRVGIGDDIGGWRVTEVGKQQIVIALGERSVAIAMFAPRQGGGRVAAVHVPDRVLEVNAAGVLRSHRIHAGRH